MDTRPTLVRRAPWIALAVCAALVATLGLRYRNLSNAYERLRLWAILPHAGLAVPAFSTSTLDGERVTIGGAAAPATRQVLFVLRTTCPYCRATLPVWERIVDSLRSVTRPSIELFAVSLDATEPTRAYVRANHLSYPVLTFPDPKLVSLYRAVATPQTLVLDAGGRVLYARTGLLDDAVIVDSILRAATWLPSHTDTIPLLPGAPVAGGTGR